MHAKFGIPKSPDVGQNWNKGISGFLISSQIPVVVNPEVLIILTWNLDQ